MPLCRSPHEVAEEDDSSDPFLASSIRQIIVGVHDCLGDCLRN